MTKKISISLSDHIYDMYFSELKSNRSRYIEKLILLGAEAEMAGYEKKTALNVKLLGEIRDLQEENRSQAAQIARLKKHKEEPKEVEIDLNKGWDF